jgi:hypothetical protein
MMDGETLGACCISSFQMHFVSVLATGFHIAEQRDPPQWEAREQSARTLCDRRRRKAVIRNPYEELMVVVQMMICRVNSTF